MIPRQSAFGLMGVSTFLSFTAFSHTLEASIMSLFEMGMDAECGGKRRGKRSGGRDVSPSEVWYVKGRVNQSANRLSICRRESWEIAAIKHTIPRAANVAFFECIANRVRKQISIKLGSIVPLYRASIPYVFLLRSSRTCASRIHKGLYVVLDDARCMQAHHVRPTNLQK